MLLLLFALAGASVLAPFLIKVLHRPAFGILALVPAAGFIWILKLFNQGTFSGGGALVAHYGWMSSAHLDLTFQLDSLSALFSLIILGIGSLVMIYCWGYFDSTPKRLRTFAGQMMAFAMAMFGLVISDNFLIMYVFWEITSILSFLLVGYYGERATSRRAATQALMVTTLGGLSMLVGLILLGTRTQVWTFSGLIGLELEGIQHISYAMVLILAGVLSKSAIAPMHFWLPGAMAAPTPVSAYLHSAAMVKAGIYLAARLSPSFNFADAWYLVIIPLALLTMIMAGWMSLKQKDLKLVLAYGTVSQLGFIMTIVGIGSREAMQAGLALTFAHSLFKATLFMIVGAVDHATGTRDHRELSGLGAKQPLLMSLAIISAASMAGIPVMVGFVAKEAALTAVLGEELLTGLPGQVTLVGIILGSIMTMAYSCFFVYGTFATKPGQGTSPAVEKMHSLSVPLLIPPLILTTLSVIFGVAPKFLDSLITIHLDSIFGHSEHAEHLALWHGFTLPLALSVTIIVCGALIFWQRGNIARLYTDTPALGDANHAYDKIIELLRTWSLRLTASTQRGSLAINLGIIFAVLVILPITVLLMGEKNDVRMELWDTPIQGVIAVIIIVMAIAATITHNRLSALLMVGVTGYAMAMLFAIHGAPDLALTQLLVETITVVIFMLVLRRLPVDAEWRATAQANRIRAWLSILVGLGVVVLAVFAMNARTSESISEYMTDLAEDIGHGRNTVNVLLVDIRAWDTFGEISVLIIAAIGVSSLIYRTRSFRRASRRPVLRVAGRRWLASAENSERRRNRSLLVDVVTRLLFPTMIVLSFYFFFVGHNAPGGGFAGGLVAALALTLRYLAGGRDELEEALPIDPSRLMGTGFFLSGLAVIVPMFFGYPPLTSFYEAFHLPVIGYVSLPSALVFDAGVYLIVIGLTIHILDSLGGQLDKDEEMRKQRARDRARRLRRKAERESLMSGKQV
ncbi:Na+/H+ antiporter subunit A [Corynebacterium kutscheri]|uniref:Monovalent cation/H+ antiporter subunit A n=1 Tax=Corynebacterium kutscheri TaxID=35755 RepID=A0AB38VUM6_9CORY|nr:Na+/H+ antiporter subunit A [Corynebacterium kutscheri]VEH06206.1 monovalent cation/H+ antiporter subunit A [Corynebacterium kutscheri]